MFEITAYDVISALAEYYKVPSDVVEKALGELIDEFQDHPDSPAGYKAELQNQEEI